MNNAQIEHRSVNISGSEILSYPYSDFKELIYNQSRDHCVFHVNRMTIHPSNIFTLLEKK